MDVLNEAIDTYFAGERGTGLLLIPVGLAYVGAAIWLWRTEPGGFASALGIPLLLVALVGVGVGGFLAWKTPAQVETLKSSLDAEPKAALGVEVERMEKVNGNWVVLKIVWTIMGIAGLACVMMAGDRGWMQGLGLGLLVLSTMAMVIDVFAERRALIYFEALQAASRTG